MKGKISEVVNKALEELSLDKVDFNIEHPADLSHGDYSTNVALILAHQDSNNPQEIAEKISKEIKKDLPEEIEKIEIAGPGFINFYLSPNFFTKKTAEILESSKFGHNETLKNQKIIIEFTDPNPFKEFHIGHLMSNTIGESISRLAEINGALVKRANWQGDIGLHVANAVWGMREMGDSKLPSEDTSLEEKAEFLGNAYSLGTKKSEQDENIKKEIEGINKKLFERSDEELNKLYDLGRKWSLEYFETIYEKLGTKFDYYFFESEEGENGKKMVEENISNGIFKESEGAVIYDGEKHGLHKRVFINSLGLPTYEAKELGLAKAKYQKFKYDQSIIITGNEIDEYFKVLLKAMSEVMPELASKTIHISHGMLKLSSGKMSSREGNVITALGLIEQISDLVEEKISQADRDFSDSEKDEVKEIVSISAIKYSILKQSIGKDIIFDSEKSVSFEGDSGPYLQYTYTRAKSILDKAKKEGIKYDKNSTPETLSDWKITELEKLIYRFPEITEEAFQKLAPQTVVTFATELAGAFNSFYGSQQIVNKDDKNSLYRLALTEATMKIIAESLNILGIKVPERM